MMTPKQNLMETINWGNPEYVPNALDAYYICGFGTIPITEQPLTAGKDPFGGDWSVSPIGSIPDVTKPPLLDEIGEWREKIHWPDIDSMDFTEMAKMEMANVDRDQAAVVYYHSAGAFLRMTYFLGFEEALISLVTEPEECKAFLDALTDYKIKIAEKIIDAYHPDVYLYFDDIANARSTFMSPACYREIIKPYHAKFIKYIESRGVVFAMHTCGCCESVLDDYVEIGVKIWSSAQIMNDIPALQKKYRGKLVIEGGWDSQGKPGMPDATEEECLAETRRIMEEYGKNGGFICLPCVTSNDANAAIIGDPRNDAILAEWKRIQGIAN